MWRFLLQFLSSLNFAAMVRSLPFRLQTHQLYDCLNHTLPSHREKKKRGRLRRINQMQTSSRLNVFCCSGSLEMVRMLRNSSLVIQRRKYHVQTHYQHMPKDCFCTTQTWRTKEKKGVNNCDICDVDDLLKKMKLTEFRCCSFQWDRLCKVNAGINLLLCDFWLKQFGVSNKNQNQ